MSDQPPQLFSAIDSLLAAVDDGTVLPVPAERVRLREAAGLTQAAIAQALGVRVASITAWEEGRAEPRRERLDAYRRLLEGLAHRYPATTAPSGPKALSATPASAEAPTAQAAAPVGTAAADGPAPQRRSVPPASSHRPAAKKAAAPATDARYPHGPLAVLDGDGQAYGVDGIVLDCPAVTVPELVEWTLTESGLGAPKLHRYGKDSDPLIVLTAAAAARLGLPERLQGHEQRRSLRLPDDHPAVKQVAKAKWQLTRLVTRVKMGRAVRVKVSTRKPPLNCVYAANDV